MTCSSVPLFRVTFHHLLTSPHTNPLPLTPLPLTPLHTPALPLSHLTLNFISGGGSGHEPAHAGLVGPGAIMSQFYTCLRIYAIMSQFFTCPSPHSVCARRHACWGRARGGVCVAQHSSRCGLGFGVWDLGFGVWGSGFNPLHSARLHQGRDRQRRLFASGQGVC